LVGFFKGKERRYLNMSHTPHYDEKIKTILDFTKPGERVCELTGQKWEMTEEEISWYRKFQVPPVTTISPVMRRKILFGFNSGIHIWWNKHARTGEPILSYVHPANPIPVIPDQEWFSDDFEINISQEIDISKSFFDQIRSFVFKIPIPALRTYGTSKNTIGVATISAEDCFMTIGAKKSKRCAYTVLPLNCEDVYDSFFIEACSSGFGLCQSERLYQCVYAIRCKDCLGCSFVFDCRNCEYCFLSANLRNRKYVFLNEQLSKEAYEAKMREIDLSSWSRFIFYKKQFFEFLQIQAIWPENFNFSCTDCTGEYLSNCVRCHECFTFSDGTDCFYCQWGFGGAQESAFSSGLSGSSRCYSSAGNISSSDLRFCNTSNTSHELEYCYNCVNCEYCFGCVGLKQKRFCILNKPYCEEEYWQKVDELKCAMLERGEYGLFFPADFSPVGFSFATDFFFDWTQEELECLHVPFFDPKQGTILPRKKGEDLNTQINSEEIPDCLEMIDPSIYISKPIYDPIIDRKYAVLPADLTFYQMMHLPFPKEHFLRRIREIARLSNSMIMTSYFCELCKTSLRVAENLIIKQRKIYCQKCYLNYLEKEG